MNALPLRQPSPGPLLTATDRQRLNKAVVRIVVERCGVMLISADESLLAHHAQILQEMLRRDSSLQVSTVEARDESRLLERFNELLGHLTVDQARAAVLPPGAGHVWILSVQSAEQFAVAKTLARMVHDFPGSNLSLVLLIEPEWAQALAKTRPGREMMRCTFKPAGDSEPQGTPLSLAAEFNGAYGDPGLNSAGMQPTGSASVDTLLRTAAPHREGLSLRVPAFTLLLLTASAALVGLLFYSPTASREPAPMPAAKSVAPKTLDQPAELISPAPDVAVAASVVTAATALSAGTTAAAPVPDQPVTTPSVAATPAAGRVPDAASGDLGQRLAATQVWLTAAPPNTHTIQLVGSNDEKQVETYLQRLRSLVKDEEIRAFRTKAGGRDSVTVIWGSFADAREAAVARDQLPAELRSAKPILRTVQGINAELGR
jgi:hypothetical protein